MGQGMGRTGYKNRPARHLAFVLADRPNVNLIEKERQAANRARKLAPISVIWPGPSEKPASWWRDAR